MRRTTDGLLGRSPRSRLRHLVRRGWRSLLFAAVITDALSTCGCRDSPTVFRSVSRSRVEKSHSLALPASCTDFFSGSYQTWTYKMTQSLFIMDANDERVLADRLMPVASYEPLATAGNPSLSGWNVWPEGTLTAVDGRFVVVGLDRVWATNAIPIRMWSCRPSPGLLLHVELWRYGSTTSVVKMVTMRDE